MDSIPHCLLLDVCECLFHPLRVLASDRKTPGGCVVGESGHCDAEPARLEGSPRGRGHILDVNSATHLIVEELVFLGAPMAAGEHGALWGGEAGCVRDMWAQLGHLYSVDFPALTMIWKIMRRIVNL